MTAGEAKDRLEWLYEEGHTLSAETKKALEVAIAALEENQKLHATQRWIPVSSKLPEKPNMYTVTDSNGHVVRFVFTGNESSRECWRRCVKAWMPRPEPYKEDKDEQLD